MSTLSGRAARCWVAALVAITGPAAPAVFFVNTNAIDMGDRLPGDGKCEWSVVPPANERCTLRAAVQEANALPGADVILIGGGWKIVLARPGLEEDGALTGDLDILTDIAIGSIASPDLWPTVDGGGIDRVFDVHSGGKLTIGSLQVKGGNHTGGGAGINVRAGGSAEVTFCRLLGNVGDYGIAVMNRGVTTIDRCSIEGNTGAGPGGTSIVENAGSGTMTLRRSTVAENRMASFAVNHFGLLLSVVNSTIANNHDVGVASAKDLALRNATIFGHPGFGLRVNQPGAFASPSIRNSIIAGNGWAKPLGADCSIQTPGGTADTAHANLDSDGSCGFSAGAGGLTAWPALAELELAGGTTRTMVPILNSIVVDNGSNAFCEGVDQRGVARPQNGDALYPDPIADCDLGAVEALPCDTAFAVDYVTGVALGNGTTTGCYGIWAWAAEVQPGAVHSFVVREFVAIANGFTVRENATLSVARHPAAGSSVPLP